MNETVERAISEIHNHEVRPIGIRMSLDLWSKIKGEAQATMIFMPSADRQPEFMGLPVTIVEDEQDVCEAIMPWGKA